MESSPTVEDEPVAGRPYRCGHGARDGVEVEWGCCSNHDGAVSDRQPPGWHAERTCRGTVSGCCWPRWRRWCSAMPAGSASCSPTTWSSAARTWWSSRSGPLHQALGSPEDSLTDVGIVVVALGRARRQGDLRVAARGHVHSAGAVRRPTADRADRRRGAAARGVGRRVQRGQDPSRAATTSTTPSCSRTYLASRATCAGGSTVDADGSLSLGTDGGVEQSRRRPRWRRRRCVTMCRACGRWRSSGTSRCCARRTADRRSRRSTGGWAAAAAHVARRSSATPARSSAPGHAPASSAS